MFKNKFLVVFIILGVCGLIAFYLKLKFDKDAVLAQSNDNATADKKENRQVSFTINPNTQLA